MIAEDSCSGCWRRGGESLGAPGSLKEVTQVTRNMPEMSTSKTWPTEHRGRTARWVMNEACSRAMHGCFQASCLKV